MLFPRFARTWVLLTPIFSVAVFALFSLRYQPAQEPAALSYSPEALGYAITGTPKAVYRWQSWARAHEAQGGDRHVVFDLSDPKHAPPLRGRVELDLLGGSVRAQLAGAPAGEPLELWLVDDVAGTGNTAGVDDQDRRLLVGTLEPDTSGALSLEKTLGPGAFSAFEADLVAISPAGRGAERAIVSAQAGFFQTLYTSLRSGRIYQQDFDRAPGWGIPTAFAQRAPNAGRSEEVKLDELTIDAELVINQLVARGADLFFNETFGGNGRTCGTCHPRQNNLTLDSEFISALPDSDPLFVGERVPALRGLDNAAVLRDNAAVGILEDGPGNPRVMRTVPHIFALQTSIQRVPDEVAFDGIGDGGRPRPLERTGWGGDLGSADGGNGSLRNVANGAVTTLFPKRLPGQVGVDFRLPSAAELDAIEAFYRALGRVNDPLNASRVTFRNEAAQRGKLLFFRTDSQNGTMPAGKCSVCHNNFGANVDPAFFATGNPQLQMQIGLRANANFDTGVEIDPASVALRAMGVPKDGGFGVRSLSSGCTEAMVRGGRPPGGFGSIVQPGNLAISVGLARAGDCLSAFNTPPLIESLDTQPFFHNGIFTDIEEIPAFYASDAFNNSDAGRFLAARDSGNRGGQNKVKAIPLEEDDINAIGTTLRIVGGDEQLAEVDDLLVGTQTTQAQQNAQAIAPLLRQAMLELADFTEVAGGLQEDVDAMVEQITTGVQGALGMAAGSAQQDRAITQVRPLIERARARFFVGGTRLYSDDMPRVPPMRN